MEEKSNCVSTLAGGEEGFQDGSDTYNNKIRKLSSNGDVTTVAGNGNAGYKDGDGINSEFNFPRGVTIDKDGNIFIADAYNHRIRKLSSNGVVTTVAGNGNKGYQDDNGINSKFNYPFGVAIDKDGNIFISDSENNRIRKLSSNGVVTTVAGDGTKGFKDGIGKNSQFDFPLGLAIDSYDNLFVADRDNNRIRKVSANGVVTTVAGNGNNGYKDGDGINSEFNQPCGVTISKDGNIFIADTFNNRIRKLSSNGVVTTVAGDGTQGYKDGYGINSIFNCPFGLAISQDGCNIFVADSYNDRIRKINISEWYKVISSWPSTHSLLSDKNDHIFSLLLVLKDYTNLPDELNLEIVKSFLHVIMI